MNDSLFNNDDSVPNDAFDESQVSDEDDDDYNVFNNETFGDTWGGDWEEDHEKMAEIAELSRHHFDNDDNELSTQIASFILDDDDIISKNSRFLGNYSDDEMNGDDSFSNNVGLQHSFTSDLQTPETPASRQNDPYQSQQQVKPKPRPPPGFVDNNQSPFPMATDMHKPITMKNICTVEEIERSMRKPPPTSLRLEDLERNLISSVSVNNILVNSGIIRGVATRLPVNIRPASVPTVRVPTLPGAIRSQAHPINFMAPFLPLQLIVQQQHQQNCGTGLTLHQQNNLSDSILQPASNSQSSDPYDGIMAYKEKQWLASIQIMQIQANPTYQNDYYYVMYQHRQSGGRKINALKNQRDLANSVNKTNSHQYIPQQFENSLGKIQACSVTAPRKIIDMDIVEKSAVESPTSQASSSSKKFKQVLLEIEQMYTDVLKAEEAISPHIVVPPDLDVDPKALFTKTVNTLLKKDNLSTVLNIRKGKALVVRVMSHPEVCSELARSLLALLPGVAMADTDQALLRALPSVRHYLQSAKQEHINDLALSLQPHIEFLLNNKFGISVLANVLERGEALDMWDNDWCHFIGSLRCCGSRDNSKELQRPVVGIPSKALSNLLCRAEPPLPQSHISILTQSFATFTSIQS